MRPVKRVIREEYTRHERGRIASSEAGIIIPQRNSMPDGRFEKGSSTEPKAVIGVRSDSSTLGRANQGARPPIGRQRGAELFVFSLLVAAVVTALLLLWKYAVNIPALEDWEMVPYLTGNARVTRSMLWQQIGEHRRPLMLTIHLALLKLTGGHFQAPLYFSVISMAGLAAAMILVARRLRGWTAYSDAFFPLVLLNLQFLPRATYRGEQIFYLLPTMVAATILLVIVLKGVQLTIETAFLAGTCLILLPLCAAPGLAYIPFLALWYGYSGVVTWRAQEPRGKRTALLIWALMASALLEVCVYFVHFQKVSFSAHSPDLLVTLRTAVRFLTGGFGSGAAAPIWPYSGVVMLVLLTIGLATPCSVFLSPKEEQDSSRALGLLMFLGAVFTLALAMGWGRGGHGDFLEVIQYSNLAVPVLCTLYFAFMIHKSPRVGSLLQFGLLALIAIAIPFNFQAGLADARTHHAAMQSFERDLRNGAPMYELMGHYASPHFQIGAHMSLAGKMLQLHRAGVDPFAHMKEDPVMREVRIPLTPADQKDVKWSNGKGHGTGVNSYLMFALPKPMYVAGVRIRWTYSNHQSTFFRAFWRRSDTSDFPKEYQYYWSFGLEDPMMIYIADTIDQIRIHPDVKPVDFTISEIVLLVPTTD
jgi:hypothetical protein